MCQIKTVTVYNYLIINGTKLAFLIKLDILTNERMAHQKHIPAAQLYDVV